MHITPLPRSGRGTRAQQGAVGALGILLVLLGIYTLWNFLGAMLWAGIFAIAVWPLYRRAMHRFGVGRHNTLLPAIFTLAVALLFIAPLTLVGIQMAHEAHGAATWVRDVQDHGLPEPELLKHLPLGESEVDAWWAQNLADPGSARELVQRVTAGHMADYGRQVGTQVFHRVTQFAFTLITLFFLFREGHGLTQQLRRVALRAFGPGGEQIGLQIIASVHGTVDGLVLVGVAEGVLLGLVYAIAGVSHATVFGALTAVAAMIPFAAPLVFAIVSLLLLAKGATVAAIAVFGIGIATTTAADHFVRPLLIGGATQLPFIWVLLGILGGVEAWGLSGLFLGPAIMAVLILMWREWACGQRI